MWFAGDQGGIGSGFGRVRWAGGDGVFGVGICASGLVGETASRAGRVEAERLLECGGG